MVSAPYKESGVVTLALVLYVGIKGCRAIRWQVDWPSDMQDNSMWKKRPMKSLNAEVWPRSCRNPAEGKQTYKTWCFKNSSEFSGQLVDG
ncbi:hypothetical protein GGR50DRAFT_246200 [Xylaria sp. CBS 124048]|nr:hypothetical protein GGR50DRAFT_246200 [Xylaria sp. CBS 124048]